VILSVVFKIVMIIVLVVLIFITIQVGTISYFAKKVTQTIEPFEKLDPQAPLKVLFIGDSTAVGTGASTNLHSTSGWFSQDFPEASIENYSRNGMQLKKLVDILSQVKGRHFDLAVVQIGANDIVYLTNLKDIETRQREVIRLTKEIADQVIILHSGDIGDAPLFFWPLTKLYSWRSYKVREIYQKSEDERVSYVNIIELEKSVKNSRELYAADNFHLNDEGWRTWYQFIKMEIVK